MCCVVPSLGAGGAERVMSSLSNYWADAGHDVSIVTLAPVAGDAYPLDPRVRRVALAMIAESRSLVHAIALNVRRLGAMRRAITGLRPEIVITFNAQLNALVLLASVGTGVPVIVSERVYPPAYAIGNPWALLRRLTYPFADALVVQSERVRAWAGSVVARNRIHVIPNAVSPTRVSEESGAARRSLVLGIGRLAPQKGFDVLIRAFALVAGRRPDWSLTIVGQGPEEAALKQLAARLLPSRTIALPGLVDDIERCYRSAGLFVLPSRFEGFPNALLEAMANGCAVIAADCLTGPAEIVRHGVDGVLVPVDDVESLAREIERLTGDAAERERLGTRAREVVERFDVDRITGLWDDVISRVRG